jgi:predicted permease
LSHGLWERRFGKDPSVVGRTLDLDEESWTVIGIMPQGFDFPTDPDVWIPLAPNPASERGDHRLEAFGRLETGVTLEQAQADMSAVAAQLERQFPDTNRDRGIELLTFPEWIIGPEVKAVSLILISAVGLVLLLACANVSNLLIAKATARQREIGLRAALGAGRFRIMRQLLTESMLLSLLGAGAGLALAYWAVPVIQIWVPQVLPRINEVSVDANVLLFALLVSLATGIVSGMAPALQSTRSNLQEALKEGHQSSTAGPRRLRDSLVIGELALALILLIAAGLLFESFRQLQKVDPGFEPENVMAVEIALPENRYPELTPRVAVFYREVLERIDAIPGVSSAGATMVNPFKGLRPSNRVGTETEQDPNEFVPTQFRVVTPGFFRTMGIPLLRGRVFDDADRSQKVAMISETLAARLWPNENPIGKRIQWERPGGRMVSVVGVVGDIKDAALESEPPPLLYYSHDQLPWPGMTLVVKTVAGSPGVTAALREAIWAVDQGIPLPEIGPLEGNLAEVVAGPRFNMQLLGLFAALALAMASMGIYGVISYSVSRRRREIGVRVALGAQPKSMVILLLRHGLRLIIIGVSLGALGAFGLTRFLASLLYETPPTHPATFVATALILVTVGAMASTIPARRAAEVDPAEALRNE